MVDEPNATSPDGGNDPVLRAYLAAPDEAQREEALAELVGTRASAIARQVILRFGASDPLAREDADDIVSTVNLRLLRKLRALLLFEGERLRQFEDYVVKLSYNAIYDLLRRRFPERTRLKNRTRYLLTHNTRFALWMTSAGPACGMAKDRGRGTIVLTSAPRLPGRDEPAAALERLFQSAGAPLLLDDVVSILADAWRIGRVIRAVTHTPAAPEPPPETKEETVEYVRALWREIASLPAPQRAALLLNSRDGEGGSGITPFLFLGIATFDEIAAANGFTSEELGMLWDDLPMEDLTIAGLLDVTRQQVINLRKSARERLIRRMRKQR